MRISCTNLHVRIESLRFCQGYCVLKSYYVIQESNKSAGSDLEIKLRPNFEETCCRQRTSYLICLHITMRKGLGRSIFSVQGLSKRINRVDAATSL